MLFPTFAQVKQFGFQQICEWRVINDLKISRPLRTVDKTHCGWIVMCNVFYVGPGGL